MRVLHVAQYIYQPSYPEFRKNKSGLGIMVQDICSATSEYDEIFLLTHAITQGHGGQYNIIRHKMIDVIKGFSLKNFFYGIKRVREAKTDLRSSFHLLYYAVDIGTLKSAIISINPDVIHIHEYTPAMRGFIDYCDEMKLNYIVTCHGLLAEKKCEDYIKQAEVHMMEIYNKSRVIITSISSLIREKLIRMYNIKDPSGLHVVLNGVQEPKVINRNNATDKLVLICVGQLSERKNQAQIVRAIRLLDNELKERLKVYFIGNDTLNGRIQSLIYECGLSNIIECTGFVERDKLHQYYEMADGLIVASHDEGFGLPIVEAMMYGVPCVMFSDIDAVKDLASEETTILVEGREDINLSTAINDLVKKEWKKDVIRSFASQFTIHRMGESYHQIYQMKSFVGKR